jgi:hypothetical protein
MCLKLLDTQFHALYTPERYKECLSINSMKRIKDRTDSNSTSYNSRANEQMIRYRQFGNGEGELKTGLSRDGEANDKDLAEVVGHHVERHRS